jgi:hypothetical protein
MTTSPNLVSFKELPLADLRAQATLNVEANQFSAQSWVNNAKKCAEDAAVAEREDRQEEAFVKYLKACG